MPPGHVLTAGTSMGQTTPLEITYLRALWKSEVGEGFTFPRSQPQAVMRNQAELLTPGLPEESSQAVSSFYPCVPTFSLLGWFHSG